MKARNSARPRWIARASVSLNTRIPNTNGSGDETGLYQGTLIQNSANYDRFGMEDGRGWMARLAPVRDELLRGDLRSLYIGWLAAVAREMMDDDETEPFAVSGLANLTAAQRALAEFIEVDPDLLAGAGMGAFDDLGPKHPRLIGG